jgi:hypothetical protein
MDMIRYDRGDVPTSNNQCLLTKVCSTADKSEGVKIVDRYQQMFEKATTFSSILAAVLFSAMVLDLDTSKIPHGNENELRIWAATGAMLFVILVLLCTGCSLGLKFHGDTISNSYGDGGWRFFILLTVGSFLFQGLLLSGTCCFCLVLKAYVPAIGWTAFGITVLCAVVCFIFWVLELIFEIPKHRKRRRESVQPLGIRVGAPDSRG